MVMIKPAVQVRLSIRDHAKPERSTSGNRHWSFAEG